MNILRTGSIWGFLVLSALALPAEEIRRIDQRYGDDAVTESPDFRMHIVPLMSRLGCNGRACHGSFQGQGGFRLSLFGYDFKSDHQNLMEGDEPRVQPGKPAESLAMRKALTEEPHEGGKRFDTGTWQHRVFAKWIKDGAKPMPADAVDFVRLDVTPAEMVATKKGDTWQLKAVAVWSDGSSEDVTPLCRFQSNNDQVATITEHGLVTAQGPGDTHVVAFYDNGVVPVPVMHPVSQLVGPQYPKADTPTKIDQLVVNKLQKLGIVQAETCTDAEFLRRVSLDIAGTLPTAAEVEAFLADSSSDKRAKKIDELLERPAYAAWWATKFNDWMGNNARYVGNNNGVDRRELAATQWYEWTRRKVADNIPYDKMIEGVVLAKSRAEDETYEQFCERMSSYYRKGSDRNLGEHSQMPYYWTRSNQNSPEERALSFAYTFLGVRIQCAQCHKHPFDQWTKDDFDRFKGFFGRIKYGPNGPSKKDYQEMLAKLEIETNKKNGNDISKMMAIKINEGKVAPFQEVYIEEVKTPRPDNKKNSDKGKRPQVVQGRTAKVLGGDEVVVAEMPDPRTALMDWMRDEKNPYFTKAIVNRVWAGYFHRGIVEPTDDLSLANPPSNEELFDYLAEGFREHNYDLKWLHREICNSRTYQLSWKANDTNRLDERNFSRAVPRRIPAEVAYDSVRIATTSDQEAAKLVASADGRAISEAIVTTQGNGRGKAGYALTVFGRSIRESNCDCDRSEEASLLQTVYLQNDQELLDQLQRKGSWVDQVVKTIKGPSEEETVVGKRKRASRDVDQLKAALKKAESADNENRIEKIKKELAAAEERAAKLREVAEDAPLKPMDTTEIVRQAYLRTVNRLPTAEEAKRAEAYFAETGDIAIGTRDLLWALLNTKEFVVNH
ncbi:MAG TPA: DUF1549 domain-containing protein [Planctomycetaceae bacterium]|nr:DUF1549 domain-containing protein [Planctomycetaceae bacterium]